MKESLPTFQAPNPPGKRRGFALVLVLGFLVLMTGLVIAFFTSVTTDSGASRNYASQISVNQLADSAVQTVLAQIRAATSQGTGVAWASQPGMIRTYGTPGGDASSEPLTYYKLYSSDDMEVSSGEAKTFDPANDVDPEWDSKPTLFTDLNAPAANSSGTNVFPIINPLAAAKVSGYSTVDGFTYFDSSNATKVNGVPLKGASVPKSTTDDSARLPMPVKWMYVLSDGSLTAADSTSGTVATFTKASTAKQPTAANPIVARIAFWTDDESCKLNINTASEGSPWNTPTYVTPQDVCYSLYQPSAYEYQRIPGHPAKVSLSPVFWSLFGLNDPNYCLWPLGGSVFMAGDGDPQPKLSSKATNYYNAIMGVAAPWSPGITPRTVTADTGSKVGTEKTSSQILGADLIGKQLTVNHDRLYTSLDELAFAAPKNGTIAAGEGQRGTGLITPADLSKLRFFLTANSQAPEVNLFDQPRISLWPVPDTTQTHPYNSSYKTQLKLNFNVNQRSVVDSLMAFCATLESGSGANSKKYPYYFSRFDPTSPTNDYVKIPRNQELVKYIRDTMERSIPGFGTTFASRSDLPASARDELAVMLFDFIRSSVNTVDSSNGNVPPAGSTNTGNARYTGNESKWLAGCYTVPPVFTKTGAQVNSGAVTANVVEGTATVAPISVNLNGTDCKGIGNFPALRAITLIFCARYADQPPVRVDQYRRPLDANGNLVVATRGSSIGLTATQIDSLTKTPPIALSGTDVLTLAQAKKIVEAAQINPLHPFLIPNGSSTYNIDIRPPKANNQIFKAGNPCFTTSGTVPGKTHPELPGLVSGLTSFEYPTVSGSAVPTVSGTVVISGQTHTGLRFLPILNQVTGAYDIPNKAYSSAAPKLNPHETSVEVAILPQTANLSVGWPNPVQTMQFEIPTNFKMKADSNEFPFPNAPLKQLVRGGQGANFSDLGSFYQVLCADANGKTFNFYSTSPVVVGGISGPLASTDPTGGVFQFSSDPITLNVRMVVPDVTTPKNGTPIDPPVQTISFQFPTANFPTPKLVPIDPSGRVALSSTTRALPSGMGIVPKRDAAAFSGRPTYHLFPPEGYFNPLNTANTCSFQVFNPYDYNPCDTFRSLEVAYGDPRVGAVVPSIDNGILVPQAFYYTYRVNDANNTYYPRGGTVFRGLQAYTSGSPIGYFLRSTNDMIRVNTSNGKPNPNLYPTYFQQVPNLSWPTPMDQLTMGNGVFAPFVGTTTDIGGLSDSGTFYDQVWSKSADIDNGINLGGPYINKPDEGMVSVAGNYGLNNPYFGSFYMLLGGPLFSPNRQMPSAVKFGSLPVGIDPKSPNPKRAFRTLQFSPNPNLSSSAYADGNNRMTTPANPPDWLLLDLFQMPIVKPYAISGPFSTAGKINMNYQIAPFSYITRNTALRGVFKSVSIPAVEDRFIKNYNGWINGNIGTGATQQPGQGTYDLWLALSGYLGFYYPIHPDETLKQFDDRFNTKKDLFRSPAEICSLWLYPAKQPAVNAEDNPKTALVKWDSQSSAIKDWWYSGVGSTRKAETGDNMRERPYAEIYPLLTTQSNTYMVHFKVQALKKAQGSNPAQWDESKDQVTSEFRGSSAVERYIDASDPAIIPTSADKDFTADPKKSMGKYYKVRVLYTKKFDPQ